MTVDNAQDIGPPHEDGPGDDSETTPPTTQHHSNGQLDPWQARLIEFGFAEPPPPPVVSYTAPTNAEPDAVRDRAYALGALRSAAQEMATTPSGRNDELNRHAFKLAGFIASGALAEEEIVDALTDAGRAASGLGDHAFTETEIRDTLRSALGSKGFTRVTPDDGSVIEVAPGALGGRAAGSEKATATTDDREASDWRAVSGGAFIFDRPDTIPAVWGTADEVLWPEGESLMIAGPQGLGKTTLEGMLIGALLGLNGGVVLGLPLVDTGQRILLLAMDRPHQIGRSLKRQFAEDTDRLVLDQRLVIRPRPPPGDLAKNPSLMVAMAVDLGCGVVFVDSVKDAAIGLSDDEVGASYNRARQHVLAADIQHCDLHHTKKLTDGTIADVYGSTWLTSGCGSVIMLTGEPGDPLVGFRHAKIPAAEVGPFRLSHDQTLGLLSIDYQVDLFDLVRIQEADGLVAISAAACMFNTETPTRAQCEKARRKLDGLVDAGLLRRVEGTKGGPSGGTPTTWFVA